MGSKVSSRLSKTQKETSKIQKETEFTEQSRSYPQSHHHEQLVSGYIRNLNPDVDAPRDIYRLCFRYYLIRKWILIPDASTFHLIDATTLRLNSNIIESTMEQRSFFDNKCLIPNLPTNIVDLFPSDLISSNHNYYGIITQNHDYFVGSNPPPPSMYLYAFKLNEDGIPQSTNGLVLKQDPLSDDDPIFHQLIYCGVHGIIGIVGLRVYQLKMDEIDQRFEFKLIGHDDAREDDARMWDEPEHWKMQYLEHRNILMAFRQSNVLKSLGGERLLFECMQFGLDSNVNGHHQWTPLCSYEDWGEREKYIEYKWNVCYHENDLYFVSNHHHVIHQSNYDNEAVTIMRGEINKEVHDVHDRIFMKMEPLPMVWINEGMNECYSGMLMSMVIQKDGCIVFKMFDLKQKAKEGTEPQWVTCSRLQIDTMKVTMFDDANYSSSDDFDFRGRR